MAENGVGHLVFHENGEAGGYDNEGFSPHLSEKLKRQRSLDNDEMQEVTSDSDPFPVNANNCMTNGHDSDHEDMPVPTVTNGSAVVVVNCVGPEEEEEPAVRRASCDSGHERVNINLNVDISKELKCPLDTKLHHYVSVDNEGKMLNSGDNTRIDIPDDAIINYNTGRIRVQQQQNKNHSPLPKICHEGEEEKIPMQDMSCPSPDLQDDSEKALEAAQNGRTSDDYNPDSPTNEKQGNGGGGAFDEYFIPVNTHKKYLRGEKLYLTKDSKKLCKNWRRVIVCGLITIVIAVAILVGVLAATGILLAESGNKSTRHEVHGDGLPDLASVSLAGSHLARPPKVSQGKFQPMGTVDVPLVTTSLSQSGFLPTPIVPVIQPDISQSQTVVPNALVGEFTIVDENFTRDLNDATSYGYLSLSTHLENELSRIFKENGGNFEDLKILEFRPGSIIVKFVVEWETDTGVILAKRAYQILKQYFKDHKNLLLAFQVNKNSLNFIDVVNECRRENGGCAQLCHWSYLNSTKTCTCKESMKLSEDGKSCAQKTMTSEGMFEVSKMTTTSISIVPEKIESEGETVKPTYSTEVVSESYGTTEASLAKASVADSAGVTTGITTNDLITTTSSTLETSEFIPLIVEVKNDTTSTGAAQTTTSSPSVTEPVTTATPMTTLLTETSTIKIPTHEKEMDISIATTSITEVTNVTVSDGIYPIPESNVFITFENSTSYNGTSDILLSLNGSTDEELRTTVSTLGTSTDDISLTTVVADTSKETTIVLQEDTIVAGDSTSTKSVVTDSTAANSMSSVSPLQSLTTEDVLSTSQGYSTVDSRHINYLPGGETSTSVEDRITSTNGITTVLPFSMKTFEEVTTYEYEPLLTTISYGEPETVSSMGITEKIGEFALISSTDDSSLTTTLRPITTIQNESIDVFNTTTNDGYQNSSEIFLLSNIPDDSSTSIVSTQANIQSTVVRDDIFTIIGTNSPTTISSETKIPSIQNAAYSTPSTTATTELRAKTDEHMLVTDSEVHPRTFTTPMVMDVTKANQGIETGGETKIITGEETTTLTSIDTAATVITTNIPINVDTNEKTTTSSSQTDTSTTNQFYRTPTYRLIDNVSDTSSVGPNMLNNETDVYTIPTAVSLDMSTTVNQTGQDIITTVNQTGLDIVTTVNQTGLDIVTTVNQTGLEIVTTVNETGLDIVTTVNQTGLDIVTTVNQTGLDIVTTVPPHSKNFTEYDVYTAVSSTNDSDSKFTTSPSTNEERATVLSTTLEENKIPIFEVNEIPVSFNETSVTTEMTVTSPTTEQLITTDRTVTNNKTEVPATTEIPIILNETAVTVTTSDMSHHLNYTNIPALYASSTSELDTNHTTLGVPIGEIEAVKVMLPFNVTTTSVSFAGSETENSTVTELTGTPSPGTTGTPSPGTTGTPSPGTTGTPSPGTTESLMAKVNTKSTMVGETTESLAVTGTTENPLVSGTTESLRVLGTTRNPTVTERTQNPMLTGTTGNSIVIGKTESPEVTETTQSLMFTDTTHSPTIAETTQSPTIAEATQYPMVTETTENPMITHSTNVTNLTALTTISGIGEDLTGISTFGHSTDVQTESTTETAITSVPTELLTATTNPTVTMPYFELNPTTENLTTMDYMAKLSTHEDYEVFNSTMNDTAVTIGIICRDDQFLCSSLNQCLNNTFICDGIPDCPDGFDERDCGESCNLNFRCHNSSTCIMSEAQCDGVWDCDDGSDERNCTPTECAKHEVMCLDGSTCIKPGYICDWKYNCRDRSDEVGCVERTTCESGGRFFCNDGLCIPWTLKCDGNYDCKDREDEGNCTCLDDEFKCNDGKCLKSSSRCDGHRDCLDAEDEMGCVNVDSQKTVSAFEPYSGSWSLVCAEDWNLDDGHYLCQELGFGHALSTDKHHVSFNGTWMAMKRDNLTAASLWTERVTFAESCSSNMAASVTCQKFDCGNYSSLLHRRRKRQSDELPSTQWPFIAHVSTFQSNKGCLAEILTPVWLVTSAECLLSIGREPHNGSDWYVRTNVAKGFNSDQAQNHEVLKIIPHPHSSKFRSLFLRDYDVALVRLKHALVFSDKIGAICLPEEQVPSGITCFSGVLGFDKPRAPPPESPTVSSLALMLLDKESCNVQDQYNNQINNRMLCTKSSDSQSVCDNDEGTPLICLSVPNKWFLAGMLTYQRFCGVYNWHPAVYSNLYAMRNFVDQVIGQRHYDSQYDSNMYVVMPLTTVGPTETVTESLPTAITTETEFETTLTTPSSGILLHAIHHLSDQQMYSAKNETDYTGSDNSTVDRNATYNYRMPNNETGDFFSMDNVTDLERLLDIELSGENRTVFVLATVGNVTVDDSSTLPPESLPLNGTQKLLALKQPDGSDYDNDFNDSTIHFNVTDTTVASDLTSMMHFAITTNENYLNVTNETLKMNITSDGTIKISPQGISSSTETILNEIPSTQNPSTVQDTTMEPHTLQNTNESYMVTTQSPLFILTTPASIIAYNENITSSTNNHLEITTGITLLPHSVDFETGNFSKSGSVEDNATTVALNETDNSGGFTNTSVEQNMTVSTFPTMVSPTGDHNETERITAVELIVIGNETQIHSDKKIQMEEANATSEEVKSTTPTILYTTPIIAISNVTGDFTQVLNSTATDVDVTSKPTLESMIVESENRFSGNTSILTNVFLENDFNLTSTDVFLKSNATIEN